MIEWLWDHLILQRFDRIARTGLQYNDVFTILSIVGACMVVTMWVLRKSGAAPDVAGKWEDDIRKTAEVAKREGWAGVQHWHARFGFNRKKPDVIAKPSETRNLSGAVFLVSLVAFVGLIAWLSR